MKLFLFILSITASLLSYGQEIIYVNTNNLVLRDRLEKAYNVYAILQAPCPLTIEGYTGYKNDKAVKAKYYRVSVFYKDSRDLDHFMYGWVEKKYVVSALAKVTVRGVDKSVTPIARELMRIVDNTDCDPDKFNAAKYPPPKYKGAELAVVTPRVYHPGPRGGCYYLDPKGRKKYVNARFCK